MKIYKTVLFFTDVPDGSIHKCDTIEHEGRFWLVPDWLEAPALKLMKPIRIICLDTLPHQKTIGNSNGDFVLNQGIPKAVFDGKLSAGFLVIESPDITIPVPTAFH